MSAFAPRAGRFISAVRRRILIIRVAESIAISIAIASIAGLILVPILWWRGESALPLAEGIIALGCAAGIIIGISRRPSRLQAAIEADRQLGLHDLLGTVLMLDRCESPADWQESMAALAEDRCRSLHPSAIIASRLGIRSWAGVGVLSALLITLALFTTRPTDVTAEPRILGYAIADSKPPSNSAVSANENSTASISRPPGPGGTDDNSARGFQQNRPDDSNDGSIAKGNDLAHSSSELNLSTGSGAATTHDLNHFGNLPDMENIAGKMSGAGPLAGGDAGQMDAGINQTGENNSTAANWEVTKQTAQWSPGGSVNDSNAANQAISAGRVPDADADLVRDYFKRD